MIFDTDVLLWLQRGNAKAARLVDRTEKRFVSVYTYLELLQGAQNREQHRIIQAFLKDLDFSTLPLTENIGHRAAVYMEQYALSHGLQAGDAVVAATAAQYGYTLCTGNVKHFRAIAGLELKKFTP